MTTAIGLEERKSNDSGEIQMYINQEQFYDISS